MNLTKFYHVRCQWTEPDYFFVWANDAGGRFIDGQELKHHLFAWHRPTCYGHFVETERKGRTPGIRLDAELALDFFTQWPVNPLLQVNLNEEALDARRWAAELADAMREDRIRPDFADWHRGRLSWRIVPKGDPGTGSGTDSHRAGKPDFLDDWITALWTEKHRDQPEHPHNVERLLRMLNLKADGADAGIGQSEQDWLMSIGWIADECPFRVCLRLGEPGDWQAQWPLSIVLQDRAGDLPPLVCDESGAPYEPLPEAWGPYRHRIDQELAKWLRLVPRLSKDGGASLASGAASAGTAGAPRVETQGDPVPEAEPETASGTPQEDPGQAVAAAAAGQPPDARPDEAGPDDTVPDVLAPEVPAPDARLRSSLSDREAWRLLAEDSQVLIEAGCTVLLPIWWRQLRPARMKLKLRVTGSEALAQSERQIGLDQLLGYDWRVSVGDHEITEAEFRQIVEEDRRLIRLGKTWVQLDPDTLMQLRETMKAYAGRKGLSLGAVLSQYLLQDAPAKRVESGSEAEESPDLVDIEPDVRTLAFIRELLPQSANHSPAPPRAFKGELRHYQQEGAYWLFTLRRRGFGACLADDMGLGKTIQYIAYLLYVKEHRLVSGPSLLVCPTSVLGNWQKELSRFAPALQVCTHHGPDRTRTKADLTELLAGTDLMLTTYSLVHQDRELLHEIEWDSVCLDEAQNIKNPYTKQSSAVRKLKARQKIAMTGTPVENRMHELWSIFHTILPGYLGSLQQFQRRFAAPVERVRDEQTGELLRRLVRPFLLRRSKQDPEVALDLPEKIESKLYVPLTVEQAALYERSVRGLMDRISQSADLARRGLVLASLTALKQICDHPALHLREPIAIRSAAGAKRLIERSGKLSRLAELIAEIRERDEQCLIFTQYVEMGNLLKHVLESLHGEPVQFLHGGTPKAQRDRMIEAFQSGSLPESGRTRLFILSLKAGGTGLNLTAANHVVHYDRWWNPAVENQATDRAHRIGQTRSVNVYKFVTMGTMEEKIDDLIERKTQISRTILQATGEGWVTELSDEELEALLLARP